MAGVDAALPRPVARLRALQPRRQGAKQVRLVPQRRVAAQKVIQRIRWVGMASVPARRGAAAAVAAAHEVVQHAVQRVAAVRRRRRRRGHGGSGGAGAAAALHVQLVGRRDAGRAGVAATGAGVWGDARGGARQRTRAARGGRPAG
jgi:hypothetical protein